jgi:hypothetical protein
MGAAVGDCIPCALGDPNGVWLTRVELLLGYTASGASAVSAMPRRVCRRRTALRSLARSHDICDDATTTASGERAKGLRRARSASHRLDRKKPPSSYTMRPPDKESAGHDVYVGAAPPPSYRTKDAGSGHFA